MGCKVVIADSAIDDLRGIVAFIAQDDPTIAARVGNRLIDFALALGDFPERCPFFDEARGIRKTVLSPYLIFFTVDRTWPESVNVIHFWHGARQYPDFGT